MSRTRNPTLGRRSAIMTMRPCGSARTSFLDQLDRPARPASPSLSSSSHADPSHVTASGGPASQSHVRLVSFQRANHGPSSLHALFPSPHPTLPSPALERIFIRMTLDPVAYLQDCAIEGACCGYAWKSLYWGRKNPPSPTRSSLHGT